MRRDMDLVRTILMAIEKSRDDEPASIRLPVRAYDDLHLSYHVRLLKEAGYIHAIENHRMDGIAWTPHSLTWQGHDFLDAVRDDAIWADVKQAAITPEGDAPAEILYALALERVKRKVGLA
ncbi:MAG: DUF2513 domain-containing protein [Rhodobiaceae bacterium]|nr:DUF2513 domain-containing protein [Rhodobiaceae bacterium]MCC0015800.1 DUF2513 domain-containing protein [Rhodobiaceae bacterium]MCC0040585.1 DUF2513 domain-containing protein [Rhodobiaceae bacterium]MCC0054058.1 DUF2513 domain-containing protein [Rhodobiaceae bacterium]